MHHMMEHSVAYPIHDPERMLARRETLDDFVGAVGDQNRHAIVIGPPGSGRSTVLLCAVAELRKRGARVVHWEPISPNFDSQALAIRSLLSALIEAVGADGQHAAAVDRWRKRVWLGDTTVGGPADVLASGLALAREGVTHVDPHLLSTELRTLRRLLGDSELAVVALDDAEPLFEDTDLLELLSAVLRRSGWTLAMSGRSTCIQAMLEARSSAVRQIVRVPLKAPTLREVRDLLTDGGRYHDLLPKSEGKRLDLSFDVGRLTNWLPLQMVLVRRALVEAAVRDTSAMSLNVPVIRRAVELLAEVSRHREDLRRLQRVTPETLRQALSILPYGALRVREIAMCRALGLRTGQDTIDLDADLDAVEQHAQEAEHEIGDLQAHGLVERVGEHFLLRGGAAASLFYEAAALELQDAQTDVLELPFNESFLDIMGASLARSIVGQAIATVGGGWELGELWSLGERAEPQPLVEGLQHDEATALRHYLSVWDHERVLALSELGHLEILVVGVSISDTDDQTIGPVTVWCLDRETPESEIAAAIWSARDRADRLRIEFGFRCGGMPLFRSTGEDAIHLLHRLALADFCQEVVDRYKTGDIEGATRLATANVAALRSVAPDPDSLYADAHSHLGFLLTRAGRLEEACRTLEFAAESTDRWIVTWNLAVAQLGAGRTQDAQASLERSRQRAAIPDMSETVYMQGWTGSELVAFELRDATQNDVREVIEAQRSLTEGPPPTTAKLGRASTPTAAGSAVTRCGRRCCWLVPSAPAVPASLRGSRQCA